MGRQRWDDDGWEAVGQVLNEDDRKIKEDQRLIKTCKTFQVSPCPLSGLLVDHDARRSTTRPNPTRRVDRVRERELSKAHLVVGDLGSVEGNVEIDTGVEYIMSAGVCMRVGEDGERTDRMRTFFPLRVTFLMESLEESDTAGWRG